MSGMRKKVVFPKANVNKDVEWRFGCTIRTWFIVLVRVIRTASASISVTSSGIWWMSER